MPDWQVWSILLALGPVACLGGGLLGVLTGRWVRFPGAAAVVVVAVVAIDIIGQMPLIYESTSELRLWVPWAMFHSGSETDGTQAILAGNPAAYLGYVLCLCAAAALVAIWHDKTARTGQLRILLSGVVVIGLACLALAITTGNSENISSDPSPSRSTSDPALVVPPPRRPVARSPRVLRGRGTPRRAPRPVAVRSDRPPASHPRLLRRRSHVRLRRTAGPPGRGHPTWRVLEAYGAPRRRARPSRCVGGRRPAAAWRSAAASRGLVADRVCCVSLSVGCAALASRREVRCSRRDAGPRRRAGRDQSRSSSPRSWAGSRSTRSVTSRRASGCSGSSWRPAESAPGPSRYPAHHRNRAALVT